MQQTATRPDRAPAPAGTGRASARTPYAGRPAPSRPARTRAARFTVLHVAQPVTGGVARVVTELIRAQVESGLRVALACPPGGALAREAAAAGAALHRWDAGREPGAGLAREIAGVARAVRRAAPDLVHAHSAKAGLAARLAVRGRVPTVFQPHAWSFEAVTGTRARLARHWERRAARWTARILCVSDDELRRGRRAGVEAEWAVVPNGVDTAAFPPASPGDAARARAALPALRALPDEAPLLVCLGRLCRQKGQDVLLRAWPRIAARHPDARLALVGDGAAPPLPPGEAAARVLLAGPTTDPGAWYAAADLVVQPSRWEGMALAPLEAMACSRPVVLSEVDGARESLPAGQAGPCLVPPEDPHALASAVLRLLADPELRAELGDQAQRHVRAERDVRRTATAVDALYRDLLGLPDPGLEEPAGR
ncbi:glycosyltransferase [Streptomyces sp. JJ36]|nr:glycosyltransferase [Streptomyces sp. JJ36]